jgi:GTPase
MESLLGTRVFLELHVVVEENWRESRYFVDSLDWRKQLEDLAKASNEKADASTDLVEEPGPRNHPKNQT